MKQKWNHPVWTVCSMEDNFIDVFKTEEQARKLSDFLNAVKDDLHTWVEEKDLDV